MCVVEWIQALASLSPDDVVAIDGKTMRLTRDKRAGRQAIHLVSAWASANTLTLGQVMIGEKSKEITTISLLLERPKLSIYMLAIDAMGCKNETRWIVYRDEDYLLAVKEHQGQLYQDIRDPFETGGGTGPDRLPHDYTTTLNTRHGHIERTECWSIDYPSFPEYLSIAGEWLGLHSVVMVEWWRGRESGDTVQARYYNSSLDASAEWPLAASRAHWIIEDWLH